MIFLAFVVLFLLSLVGLYRAVYTKNKSLGLASASLLLIVVSIGWLFGPYLVFFTLLPLIKVQLAGLAINPWLGSAIGIVMTVVLIIALSYVFSLSPRNRQVGFGLFIGFLLTDVTAGWIVQRGFWFDPQGNPLITVSPDPTGSGLRTDHTLGVDPYGYRKERVTPELVRRIVQVEVHGAKAVPVHQIKDDEWFSAIDGRPLISYSASAPGRYRLFRHSGYDPLTGDQLEPVTRALVPKILGAKEWITSSELSGLKARWEREKIVSVKASQKQGYANGFTTGKEEGLTENLNGTIAVVLLVGAIVGCIAYQAGRKP